MKSDNRKIWDQTYLTNTADELPWDFKDVPEYFKQIIESGWVTPCKTIDIGCGLGNNSYYLSQKGFNVLAIDFSHEAIKIAKNTYNDKNLEFKVHSALDIHSIEEKFDFIYEVSLLHHIKEEDRDTYAREIMSISNANAKILICCFSDKEPFFENCKNFVNPETNTITYPLSKEEVVDIFSKYFEIEKIQEIEFGKKGSRKRLLIQMQYRGVSNEEIKKFL